MDWQILLQNLTTDSILAHFSGLDPVEVATNPYFAVPALLVIAILFFFKMIRTLAILIGIFALWLAVVYAFPQDDGGISLQNIGTFAGICLGVAALWIYILFIRGD